MEEPALEDGFRAGGLVSLNATVLSKSVSLNGPIVGITTKLAEGPIANGTTLLLLCISLHVEEVVHIAVSAEIDARAASLAAVTPALC